MASCLAFGGAVASAAPKPARCGVRGRLCSAATAPLPALSAALHTATRAARCANSRRRSRLVPAAASGDAPPVHELGARKTRVMDLPVSAIRRPLAATRANDQAKVAWLMESISEIGLQEPIDVLLVDGVYYGFSGCHRYEAHVKLGLPTIRCLVRPATKQTLKMHLM